MKKTVFLAFLILAAAASAMAAGQTIQVIQEPGSLPDPLPQFVEKGDLWISDGEYTAVIASAPRLRHSTINYDHPAVSGYVLAFLPKGGQERAVAQFGAPSVRIGGENPPLAMTSIRREGTGVLVQYASTDPPEPRLEIRTRYDFAFDRGEIRVTADIRNAGSEAIIGLNFGLGGGACQNYSFSPFHASYFSRLNFRVYQRPDHILAWFNPNPRGTSRNPLPDRLGPGQTYRVTYTLLAGKDMTDVLDRLYRMAGVRPEHISVEVKDFEGLAEIVIREPVTGAVFYRAFLDNPAPLSIPVPEGAYSVRTHAFPAVVEQSFRVSGESSENALTIEPPPLGLVQINIRDRYGRYVPGKVSFIGLAPTPSPYFEPDNPVVTGRSWEGRKNSVYPPEEGLGVDLPAGTYLVSSSRGPEYTREARVIEVLGGERINLDFSIDKAVDTRHLVSIDSHMHTQNSDGSLSIAERLRGVAAEGIEVAVSSDHNFITDYQAELDGLGLNEYLAVIMGSEVTARTGSIHYNTFPNEVRPEEPRNGAISVKDETPAALFGLSRAKDPGTLIHVNHPRSSSLGYFAQYGLEEETAASAAERFDLGFDVMEAMNGAVLTENNRDSIEDWFHLLNRGYPIRIVGSSDSHGADGSEPGYSRTYVLYAGPRGSSLDLEAVVKGLKEGRSFISNGPIISAWINRKGTFGDIVTAKRGRVEMDLIVSGAPWLDASEIRLIVNGERQAPLAVHGPAQGTVKLRRSIKLELERDSWIAVEVVGRKSLFPLIQQRAGRGLAANAALPYALTNPIFIDIDGDGTCSPLRPDRVEIK